MPVPRGEVRARVRAWTCASPGIRRLVVDHDAGAPDRAALPAGLRAVRESRLGGAVAGIEAGRPAQAKLKTIARALEAAAPVIAKQVEEGERQAELERQRWAEEERKRRREEAARRRAEALKASRAELAAIIERWAEAKRVEAFFEDAGRRAASLDDGESTAMLERLKRARETPRRRGCARAFPVVENPT